MTLLLNKEPNKHFRLELINQILTKVILAKIFIAMILTKNKLFDIIDIKSKLFELVYGQHSNF